MWPAAPGAGRRGGEGGEPQERAGFHHHPGLHRGRVPLQDPGQAPCARRAAGDVLRHRDGPNCSKNPSTCPRIPSAKGALRAYLNSTDKNNELPCFCVRHAVYKEDDGRASITRTRAHGAPLSLQGQGALLAYALLVGRRARAVGGEVPRLVAASADATLAALAAASMNEGRHARACIARQPPSPACGLQRCTHAHVYARQVRMRRGVGPGDEPLIARGRAPRFHNPVSPGCFIEPCKHTT